MFRTILFDLDGTLVDTAPDMAAALNRLRVERGRPELDYAAIRGQVSNGAAGLLRVGFADVTDAEALADLRGRFLELYRADLHRHSLLFPGMEAILGAIEASGRHWGVVTNKPGWLTDPLLAGLGLDHRAACVVSGDTLAERKPHPLPLQHACRLTGAEPGACLYVGDAARDVEAGRAAGMTTVVARFGYIPAGERPDTWGADALIDDPAELRAWLEPLEPGGLAS